MAQTNLSSPLMRMLCRTELEASVKWRQITSIASPLSLGLPLSHRRKLSWSGMIHSTQNLVCYSEFCSSPGDCNMIFFKKYFFQYLLDCYSQVDHSIISWVEPFQISVFLREDLNMFFSFRTFLCLLKVLAVNRAFCKTMYQSLSMQISCHQTLLISNMQ